MKKLITSVIVACLFMTVMNGCKKNEREFFDTGYAALNIWLGTEQIPYESVTYNFIVHNDMDAIMFYARATGVAVDYDRTFRLKAVGGHIGKVDFHIEDEYVIPAGEYSVSFPIYFGKPENYDEFKYSEGYLVFTMESDDFEEGSFSSGATSVDMRRLYIKLQNSVSKPDNWDKEEGGYLALSRFFGSYSNAKYEFMIDVLGIMGFRAYYGNNLSYMQEGDITYSQALYYAAKCKSALYNFNSDAENIASGKAPLMDEYGFAVSFDN